MSYDLRSRYLADNVATASPGRLVVLLYDRLLLDLGRAQAALAGDDLSAAIPQLRHATDILLELRGSLRLDAWSGAAGLAELYDYLVRELLVAQLHRDAARVATCRELVVPLAEAWRSATASESALTMVGARA